MDQPRRCNYSGHIQPLAPPAGLLTAPARQGLALIELLVVLGVILLLVAILIPMFLRAQEQSTAFRCQNQLRAVGEGFLAYSSQHKGRFPCTSWDPDVPVPDLSNSGWQSADPFGPNGPRPNNIPAAIFLLLRSGHISADMLICPATDGVPDDFGGAPVRQRSNFSNVRRNLTYSMHNPYVSRDTAAAGFLWGSAMKPDFAVLADRNPGIVGEDDHVLLVGPEFAQHNLRWANSNNHNKRGQNVLFADGRVEFVSHPFVGANGDNIYTTGNHTLIDCPAGPDDSILLPTDD